MENNNKHLLLKLIDDALVELRRDELADLQRRGQVAQAKWDEKRRRLDQARCTIKELIGDSVGKVDAVFDTVGGETLARSRAVLNGGGRLVTIAASEERPGGEEFFIVEPNRDQLIQVAELIDRHVIRPVVDGVFRLDEARQAYQHEPCHGKAVIRNQ